MKIKPAVGASQAKWAFFAGVSMTAGVALWLWRRGVGRQGAPAPLPPREVMRWEGEGGSLPPDEDSGAEVLPVDHAGAK